MPSTEVRFFQNSDDDCPIAGWLKEKKKREPRVYSKCLFLVKALALHGRSLKRPLSANLGGEVFEMRGQVGSVNWRLYYGFVGNCIAMISHGDSKEDKIPPADIKLASERLAKARKDLTKHTRTIDLTNFP